MSTLTGTRAPAVDPRRTAVVLQPSYLPWLGYFAQLARSDVFVLYDDVQYDKHGWRNRNRIKTAQGVQWLTVPVRTRGQGQPLIRDVEIDNATNWRKKHLQSLRQSYAKAPFFADCFPLFESLWDRSWDRLLDLNAECLRTLAAALGLEREIRLSSELPTHGDLDGDCDGGHDGDRIARLIALCRAVGAGTFYEGEAGQDYIDDRAFAAAGLRIEYQKYAHPQYPQLHGDFVPYLSIVDLLFNCGPRSLEILSS